jgi:hypothetical protein
MHGEVNGYHLDEGSFVHVKPEGAKKYELHVGQRVTATGKRHEGPDSWVMEATTVEKVAEREDSAVA